MKKWMALLAAAVLLLAAVQTAGAREEVAYTGTVTGGSLHMRREPSPSGKVIQTYKAGTEVEILENDGTWCKVQKGNKTGYMMAQYLTIAANYPHLGWGKTADDGTILNLREGPGENEPIIEKMMSGAAFELVAESGAWYRVRMGKYFAYIEKEKITRMDGEYALGLSADASGALSAADFADAPREMGSPMTLSRSEGDFTYSISYPDLDMPLADARLNAWVQESIALFEGDCALNHAGRAGRLEVIYRAEKLDARYGSVVLLAEYTVEKMTVQRVMCLNLDGETGGLYTGSQLFADTARPLFSLESQAMALMRQATDGYTGKPDAGWLAQAALTREGVDVYLPAGLFLPAALGTRKLHLPYTQAAESMALESEKISQYIRVIDPTKPMIALTFDDGPSEETARILDVLAQYNGRATFCIVGNRVETYGDMIKRAIAEGNEIASHTWSHKRLTEISTSSARSQLTRTSDAVRELTGGYEIRVLRPPYGSTNKSIRNLCKELNLVIAHWQVDTLDWETRSSSKTYSAIMKGAKNGAIILCHDLYSSTASAIERAVPELVEKGYQLVTVSELLSFHKDGAQPGTVYAFLDPENIDTGK